MLNLKLMGALTGAALTLLAPSIARASLEACGGVWLFGEADCSYVPTEECMTTCEPVAMTTSCAARLYVECDTSCTATAAAGCTETCTTTCGDDCEGAQTSDEPKNSMGLCMSSCQQDCTDACAGEDEHGDCRSTCAHNCGDKCERSKCSDDDGDVLCAPKCATSCEGTCWAQASSECEITCSAEQYTACKTELVDVCHEECEQSGGAIFCDGQFLAAAELQACADELAAEFSIMIDISGKASAEAEGEAGCGLVGCSVDPAGQGLGGLLLALGVVGVARRRRSRR